MENSSVQSPLPACPPHRMDGLVLRTPAAVWDAIRGDHPMAPRHRLGETLVVHGLSEPSDIERALTLQRQGQPRPLGQILLSEGMVVEDDLKIALAAMAGMPVVDCLAVPPQDDAVPQGTAERARVLPLLREGSTLVVAMEDPWHRPTLDELRFLSNLHIEAVMALPGTLAQAQANAYEAVQGRVRALHANTDVHELAAELAVELGPNHNDTAKEVITESSSTLVRLVNTMIEDAIKRNASDIHIEASS
ncbi:MAG: hypothetical protein IT505_03395, partial [Aquabacterium sp.]|nr:hypothetical protein [Aquabacterium sp.]